MIVTLKTSETIHYETVYRYILLGGDYLYIHRYLYMINFKGNYALKMIMDKLWLSKLNSENKLSWIQHFVVKQLNL